MDRENHMPRYFAVWSATGVHVGVWEDGKIAADVLAEYPGGTMRELVEAAALRPEAQGVKVEPLAEAMTDLLGEAMGVVPDSASAFYDYKRGEFTEARILAALDRPEAQDGVANEPCGGCGESDPQKRCVGCLHDFGDQSSKWAARLARAEDK